MARHGAQKAEENCTSVARSPSGCPTSSPLSASPAVSSRGGYRFWRDRVGGTHPAVGALPGDTADQRDRERDEKRDHSGCHGPFSAASRSGIPDSGCGIFSSKLPPEVIWKPRTESAETVDDAGYQARSP